MSSSPNIKLKYKYFIYKYDTEKKKIKTISHSKKMSELKQKIVGKKINPKNEIILLKLTKYKKYKHNPEKKSMLNKLVGPIKINIKIFEVSENQVLKPKYEKTLNRKGEQEPDKRNAQFLFMSLDYYNKKGINKDDLKKVALLGIQNKLEKRPLAPKFIDNI
jgi:hypothetical protein